jgi:RNA polymerase sigma-70 factor (ECF subfamily)
MTLDDEQRLLALARQDPQAFHRIYQHYLPRLYAYVRYRVERKQDAEDLVAETFLRVVDGLDRFEWRHEGSFAAWLFRIAHNRISTFHREHAHLDYTRAPEELPEPVAGGPLPDDVVLRKELFADLHRLIATLSPRRREVITLKFFGGLQNREIAAVLGLDERTVASNLCRALEDLYARYTRMEDKVSKP